MLAFKSKDNLKWDKSKIQVDVRHHRHEFEALMEKVENAEIKHGRSCNNSSRSSRQNDGVCTNKLMSGM